MRGSLSSPWQLEGSHNSSRNSRNTWIFPLPCKMRPDHPPVTPEHSRACPRNLNGDLTFLRQHERLPEFPGVPAEESIATHRNSRQTMRFPRSREMKPFLLQRLEINPEFPLKHQEEAGLPSCTSRGPRTPIPTQDES